MSLLRSPFVSKTRRWSIMIALLIGATFSVASRPDDHSAPILLALAVGLSLISVPRLGTAAEKMIGRLRQPSRPMRRFIALALTPLSGGYFFLSARLGQQTLLPQIHDEFMYLLQARMLSHGRLWMPQHAVPEFFDSFLIIVKPVYAAIYFPGTALLYVPGMWLHMPPWVTSVLIASVSVSLLYILVADLSDGVMGLMAALLAISIPPWRILSVVTLSHPAELMLALATACCLLRWSRNGKAGWIIIAGVVAGWAAITRPLDAMVLIAPMGLAAVIARWRATTAPRQICFHLLMASLVATPFLLLQLVQDRALTGHWLTTPVSAYDTANFPGMAVGGHGATATSESTSPLPQIRSFYRSSLRSTFILYGQHGWLWTSLFDRLPRVVASLLSSRWLCVLLVAGVVSIRSGWQLAIAITLFTSPLLYAKLPIFLNQYALIAAPALIMLILLACQAIAVAFPGVPRLSTATLSGLGILLVASLPEFTGRRETFVDGILLKDVRTKIAALDHRPAVVLFRYHVGTDTNQEPVYNLEAPWPDDCPVIRAQDRGEDNRRIFSYYAQRQPDRYFYLYDRGTMELTPLGWAKDLAQTVSQPRKASNPLP